jgi:GT2 family glycosyltransferase
MNLDDVLFVIVLYKTNYLESRTFNTLNSVLNKKVELFLFDNSPTALNVPQRFESDNFKITYSFDTLNPGLSIAYNHALLEASKEGKKWMLLLDQDTLITKNFIEEITNLFTELLDESIVAIIPRVNSFENKDAEISPAMMFFFGGFRPISIKAGVSIEPISGINSGTILKVDFMNSINGFNNIFNLDMLDHWYFREIHKAQKKVFVLESTIYQSLSVSDNYEDNVSLDRYKNMLNAELIFVKLLGPKHYILFKFRLLYRLFKQIKYRNFEYFKQTFFFLFK